MRMLPSLKRSGSDDEIEIEIVDVRNVDGSDISEQDASLLSSPKPSPKPPREREEVEVEEPTRLMYSTRMKAQQVSKQGVKPRVSPRVSLQRALPETKAPTRSSRPPAPVAAAALLPVPGTVTGKSGPLPRIPRIPTPQYRTRERQESHTLLRPLSAITGAMLAAKTATAFSVPSSPRPFKVQRVDPALLEERHARVASTLVKPRSFSSRLIRAPWFLLAVGISAGVMMAIVTGRASAIVAFLDPPHETRSAENIGASPIAPTMDTNDPAASLAPAAGPAITGSPVDVAPITPTVFSVGRAISSPAAEPVAPVQVAQQQPRAVPAPKSEAPKPPPPPKAPEAKVDSKPDPKADVKPDIKPDPKPDSIASRSAPASHPPKRPAGSDSAAAADALAKAQLENSL